MSVEIRLRNSDRVHKPGDKVSGTLVIQSKNGLSHQGITLIMEGVVNVQLSSKSVGMFEALYSSLKPIPLVNYGVQIAKPGKFDGGMYEIPFELPLKPLKDQGLHETYHGVFIAIEYRLTAEVTRGALSKTLSNSIEFFVEETHST
eukprot:GABW01000309.1.p1 GENE.GABW01000309.1~~GABW01000309.1.p1  ORF type:complete len:146 (-),score=25.85 GABW01000309.1:3-440(-)